MENAQLEQFKQRLLTIQSELAELEDTARRAGQPVQLDQQSVGRLSRMEAIQAQQMAQDSERRRQRLVAAIGGALRRIDNDDFGYCFVCEEEIELPRLQADPTITRCIQCVGK